MKRKKWYAGALSASLLAAAILTGCSSDSSSSESKDKVTIDVFQFKVEFKDQFEDVAEKYEKENPDVEINITTVGGGEDYGAALKSKFASGKEPAIYNVGGPQDVEDWKDKLADLSDTEASKLALDGTLDGVSADGKVLGLPYNQEGYGLLYNKEIFEKAGIKAEEIKTMKALEEAVETIDNKKSDLGIKAVFALPGKEKWITGLHASNVFISPEFDENIMNAYNSDKVDFKYGDQYKAYIDLSNKYSIQPTVSLDYSQQVEENFSLGKVAMIQQGNWVYGSIAGIDEEFAQDKVGILPIPVEGYKEDSLPVGIPMYWGVNSNMDEKVIEASKDFLDWLYTSEEGKKTVLEDFSFIPAYEGYDSSKISDPISKEVYEYATEGKTIGWVFMGYPTGWGENKLGVNIQKYLSDEMTWDELIKESQKSWTESR